MPLRRAVATVGRILADALPVRSDAGVANHPAMMNAAERRSRAAVAAEAALDADVRQQPRQTARPEAVVVAVPAARLAAPMEPAARPRRLVPVYWAPVQPRSAEWRGLHSWTALLALC